MHTRLLIASFGLESSRVSAYLSSYRILESTRDEVPTGGSAAGLSLGAGDRGRCCIGLALFRDSSR